MATQEKIVIAALAQFYQYGFNASGVSLLAEKAGVTKRTLYAYFPSKDDLIMATLQYRHEEFMTQLQASLQTGSAKKLITSYWQFLQDWFASPCFFGCFFINVCAEFSEPTHPFHQMAKQHKKAVHGMLSEHANQAKVHNIDQLADELFLFGEALIVARQTNLSDSSAYQNAYQRLLAHYMD